MLFKTDKWSNLLFKDEEHEHPTNAEPTADDFEDDGNNDIINDIASPRESDSSSPKKAALNSSTSLNTSMELHQNIVSTPIVPPDHAEKPVNVDGAGYENEIVNRDNVANIAAGVVAVAAGDREQLQNPEIIMNLDQGQFYSAILKIGNKIKIAQA